MEIYLIGSLSSSMGLSDVKIHNSVTAVKRIIIIKFTKTLS